MQRDGKCKPGKLLAWSSNFPEYFRITFPSKLFTNVHVKHLYKEKRNQLLEEEYNEVISL